MRVVIYRGPEVKEHLFIIDVAVEDLDKYTIVGVPFVTLPKVFPMEYELALQVEERITNLFKKT